MLVPETGSSSPTSNSYVDLAFARTYATLMGLTLPADDTEAENDLIKGMQFIESFAAMYQGHMTDPEQACQWPRKYVFLYNYRFASDAIPALLKQAQVQAAALATSGIDFFPQTDPYPIKKDKTDVLETEFDTSRPLTLIAGKPEYQAVTSLLSPLFVPNTGYRLTGGF